MRPTQRPIPRNWWWCPSGAILQAPKGRTNEATFAAGAISELLRRLEDYYDMPYPYEKLDQLAVPQFPEAMENWLLLNNRAAGYYVAAYRGELLRNLLQAGPQKLSAAERMSITCSTSAAVRSADISLGEALSLQPRLLLDPERRVVERAAGFMNQRELVPEELKSNYQRFIRKSIDPLRYLMAISSSGD